MKVGLYEIVSSMTVDINFDDVIVGANQTTRLSYHPPSSPTPEDVEENICCMCVRLNAWKCFLWFSRSCDLTSFQLLLVFCGGMLERRMFSFSIGLLRWPDKHKNKDSTGCFSWVYVILSYCSTFEMKGTPDRSSDGRMMRIPFLLYCDLASK